MTFILVTDRRGQCTKPAWRTDACFHKGIDYWSFLPDIFIVHIDIFLVLSGFSLVMRDLNTLLCQLFLYRKSNNKIKHYVICRTVRRHNNNLILCHNMLNTVKTKAPLNGNVYKCSKTSEVCLCEILMLLILASPCGHSWDHVAWWAAFICTEEMTFLWATKFFLCCPYTNTTLV